MNSSRDIQYTEAVQQMHRNEMSVGEMGLGINVQLRQNVLGFLSGWRQNVRKCEMPVGKMSGDKIFIGKMSVGKMFISKCWQRKKMSRSEMSVGKCLGLKCPRWKMSVANVPICHKWAKVVVSYMSVHVKNNLFSVFCLIFSFNF